MAEDGNTKDRIVIAVIGAAAIIFAAIIGPIGNAIIKEREISATQTKEALLLTFEPFTGAGKTVITNTSEPIAQVNATNTFTQTITTPTNLPDATATLKPPPPTQGSTVGEQESSEGSTGSNGVGATATSAPSPTQQPPVQTVPTDTPPGTILQVGETWVSNGLFVQLEKIEFLFGDEADLHFNFTNQSGRTINLHFIHSIHVTLKDDKGNLYTWDSHYEKNASIDSGETWSDEVYKGGDLSRAGYFIVQLEIPGIISAQWQY